MMMITMMTITVSTTTTITNFSYEMKMEATREARSTEELDGEVEEKEGGAESA